MFYGHANKAQVLLLFTLLKYAKRDSRLVACGGVHCCVTTVRIYKGLYGRKRFRIYS